ncbi:MAG: TonB-dependent receptor [Balneolaceae bacterium]
MDDKRLSISGLIRTHSGRIKKGCFLLGTLLLMAMYPTMDAYSQTSVRGVVTIAGEGGPLAGANIRIKGTNVGTSTDIDGAYELRIPNTDAVLVFSYIGFLPQEMRVGDQEVINISLVEDTQLLGDLVVIGYGRQSKKTIVGSVASVDAADIENVPVAGTDQLLQGRAAGVQVSANSGEPGGGIFVKIRGSSSISGGSDPLYVVDGVPIETGNFGLGLGGGTTSALADLSPGDIESMQVLKDASATAIYGARAANGVVIITTKRGGNSAPILKIGSYYGVDEPVNKPSLVSGQDFEMLINEARVNNGQAPIYANPSAATNTNWTDEVFRTGSVRNYDLSISGGNDKARYAVSGSTFKQNGVARPTLYERNSARINLDLDLSKSITFGTSIVYSNSYRNRVKNNDSITGALGGLYFFPTNLPAYDSNGDYTRFSIFGNPISVIKENDFNMNVNRFIGNVFAEVEFIPGLNFKTSWSYDNSGIKEDQYSNTLTNEGAAVNGQALSSAAVSKSWTAENTLNYAFYLGKHNFNTLIGTSAQESIFERTTAQGEQFPSDDFKRISDAAVQSSFSTGTSWGILSFFGRLQYDYDSKYILTVTARRDGSSRFGKNNRWGTFPSVALGWIVSEEDFFNTDIVSNLKLKASYGLTGNQSGIGNFQSRGLWSGASYTDSPGTTPIQLSNPDLKWETTKQLDLGFEAGILDDRVTFTFDYYNKQTVDLLLAVPVPMSSGFDELVQNYGELENKGIELGIGADVIRNQDLTWSMNFNIAGNRNKIVKLAAPFNVYNRDIYRYEEGAAMYSFYFHEQTGVDPQTGDIIFADVDGDGTFNPNRDRKIVGDANPDFFGGFTNNLNYKNFDLSIFLQYSYGNDQLNWNRFFQEHGGTRNTGFMTSQLDRWQKPGDKTMVPKMTASNYAGNLRPSRFVEDGSYLRVKTVSLGYNVPNSFIERMGMPVSKIRLYVTGQNLLTFTNYTGLDPEVTATATSPLTRGIEFYTIPQSRSVVGGFNITF